jgi:hypothetical protein
MLDDLGRSTRRWQSADNQGVPVNVHDLRTDTTNSDKTSYLKNPINAHATAIKSCFDVSRDGHRGRDVCTRACGLHENHEESIFHDFERTVVFGTPPRNESPVEHVIRYENAKVK